MTADDYADPAFEQWNNAFNACQNLYDDDELEECVNATEQDLDDPSMPLYHRMRYELLLAGSHEGLCEWWQAEDALTRCEAIFHSTSTNHKDDTDESIQKCLRDLRELIEGVRAHHAVQPHTLARPTYEDDVDMMDWYDGEADEQADKQADKDVKMEEIVEDENSVRRMPLSETGEIEDMKLVVEPEPAEPSLRLPTTPRLSADPSLPAIPSSNSKNTPRSPIWSNNPSQNLSSTPTNKPNKRLHHYLAGNVSDHQVLR